MTSASAKRASDYEAPKGLEDTRSPEQIQADMDRVRDELTQTVNELAGRLSPDNLKAQAKAQFKSGIKGAKGKALGLLQRAAAGDPKAIGIIAGCAAVTALIIRKIIK